MKKYIITDGEYYVKKKVLLIDKNTDISNFTLEQMNILSMISFGKKGEQLKKYLIKHKIRIIYYGLTDKKSEAQIFKFFIDNKLKKIHGMYGQNFVAEES